MYSSLVVWRVSSPMNRFLRVSVLHVAQTKVTKWVLATNWRSDQTRSDQTSQADQSEFQFSRVSCRLVPLRSTILFLIYYSETFLTIESWWITPPQSIKQEVVSHVSSASERSFVPVIKGLVLLLVTHA